MLLKKVSDFKILNIGIAINPGTHIFFGLPVLSSLIKESIGGDR